MDDQLPTKIQQYYIRDFCEDDRLRSRSAQSAVELGRVQSLPWLPRRHFHVSGELAAELSEAGFADVTVRGLEAPTIVALQLLKPDEALSQTALALADRIDDLVDPHSSTAGTLANLAAHLMATGVKA